MKKLIPFLLAAVVLTACQKEPNLSELSSDYVVYTDYDTKANFSQYSTYYLPDSVLVIGASGKATYWKDEKADFILGVLENNMSQRGFDVAEKEAAELGLQVSYIENTQYFVSNPINDWWWWGGYPGYWGTGYWGGYWDSWYYPYYPVYPVVYSYSTNSFVVELVDLNKDTDVDGKKRLEVLWNSYMVGAKGGSAQANKNLVERAINQAFAQSPYIKK